MYTKMPVGEMIPLTREEMLQTTNQLPLKKEPTVEDLEMKITMAPVPEGAQSILTGVKQQAAQKALPPGLAKKPGGMPPGQYKKLAEYGPDVLDISQQATTLYLDPEAQALAKQYAANYAERLLNSEQQTTAQKLYNKNAALTAKGFHPAKVPHPLLTHFIAFKK